MFFTEPYHNNLERNHWNFRVYTQEKVRDKLRNDPLINSALKVNNIAISFSESGTVSKNFNMLNFVPNAFEAEEIVNEIQKALYTALKHDESNSWIFESLEEYDELDKFIDFLGISKEFKTWHEKSLGFVLPIYDLDLVYNLVKRIRLQRIWNKTEKAIQTWSELWDYFENILKKIEEKLAENDKYYQPGNGQILELLYTECPFIKWIKNKEENLSDDFAEKFVRIVHNAVSAGEPESGDLETEVSRFED